jgi:hypothetical protein
MIIFGTTVTRTSLFLWRVGPLPVFVTEFVSFTLLKGGGKYRD